jgi:hypothetical protein
MSEREKDALNHTMMFTEGMNQALIHSEFIDKKMKMIEKSEVNNCNSSRVNTHY